MLDIVDVGETSLESYRGAAPDELLDAVSRAARALRGARVLHLNAPPYGGGVSELLRSVVPLLNDQGLKADWRIISGNEPFFQVTKTIHNGLQGADVHLSEADRTRYLSTSRENAVDFDTGYDFVFIHDPQPAAMYRLVPEKAKGWLWRCHIDLSAPNEQTIGRLLPYLQEYPEALFHMREYVPAGMKGKVHVVPPAIDPLTPKNMALSPEDAAFVCSQFGVDVDRPLMCQVSRFDPWKDPLGVIDAYRLVKETCPAVQLALVGSMASDDPEGWDYFNATIAHADGDPDIHILNNFNNVGAIEVNAFQSHSDVMVQKSTREGFGLTVTEGIWKARPFIGGSVGGIPLQIEDRVTGFLVSSAEQCAERAVEILEDPALGKFLGRRGKEHVRAQFLTPRYLRDYLLIFNELRQA